MLRASWLLLVVYVAGCNTAADQRLRDYTNDGVYLFQHGDYRAARESFQAAIALQPDDPNLHYNLGECYARQGGTAQAEKCYTECLARVPNHTACRFAMAELLVHEGRQADAARMVEGWLTSEPKRADAYALDGWLWHQKGDLPRAQGRLQQALEIDPHNERALTELGLIYESMQRPDRAVVLYERVLARNPKQPEVTKRINLLLAKGAGRPQPE